MEHSQLKLFTNKLQSVFSRESLNVLGRQSGFLKRERTVGAHRFVLSILCSFSSSGLKTISDVQRQFNALFGTKIRYKPFYNQLAKRSFPEFMREGLSCLLSELTMKVLSPESKKHLSEFREIIIHDGSSFALKDALQDHFPGRFTKIKPAAVELHASLSLLEGTPTEIRLTPDTSSERNELPEASSLKESLLLADRGYFSLDYMHELNQNGASVIIRGKADCNPIVIAASCQGKRIRKMEGKSLRKSGRLKKIAPLDLQVRWRKSGKDIDARMIVIWNPKNKSFFYLVTNLEQSKYSCEHLLLIYKLRWQIELMFKEWKSYSNLHAFDTSNPFIAEGFIWAAIASSLLKRFLAHSTQLITGTPISTHTVAASADSFLRDIFRALFASDKNKIKDEILNLIFFIQNNAARTHPKRDASSGRLQFALFNNFNGLRD